MTYYIRYEPELDELVQQMVRQKQREDARKIRQMNENNLKTRQIRLAEEKKRQTRAKQIEKEEREKVFGAIDKELAQEKKEQKQREHEITKMNRTAQQARIAALQQERWEKEQEERAEKRRRIAEDKVKKEQKLKEQQEMRKKEAALLPARLEEQRQRELEEQRIRERWLRGEAHEDEQKRMDVKRVAKLIWESAY